MTNGWWKVRCDVRGVRQRGADLFEAQRVLRGDGVGRSPAAKAPTMVATSMRVPLRHGFPNRTSGSIETPGKTSRTRRIIFIEIVSRHLPSKYAAAGVCSRLDRLV